MRADDEGPIVLVQLADSIGEGSLDRPESVDRSDDGVEVISRESWARSGPDQIVCQYFAQEFRRPGHRP